MISINVFHKDAVSAALSVIQAGGVIIYPTDTLYGFGVDATNDGAIDRLNDIKGRAGPISVLALDQETALGWGNIANDESVLIASKLKSQTTVIFPVNMGLVSQKIMGTDHTLGVRIPDHDFCKLLAGSSSAIITSTSVNRHDSLALNDPDRIIAKFGDEIDLFVNGGSLEGNKGSSIYKLNYGKFETIRD